MGRDRTGLDCVGLLHVAYRDAWGVVNDFREYSPNPTSGMVYRTIREFAHRIKAEDAEIGDVVLMHYVEVSTHFGIKTEKGIIHANQISGKVIEHGEAETTGGRVVAYFRMDT